MKYTHPVSGVEIEGVRLGPGVVVTEGDMYDSTDGTWRNMPCVNSEVRTGCKTIIVRPMEKISQGHEWILSQSFDIYAHEKARRRTS